MNNKYYFISKPRCASTHIYEGLTKWDDSKDGNKPLYHIPANVLLKHFGTNYSHNFSFSVVRNPYDLVISWYNEHRKPRYERHVRNVYNVDFNTWLTRGCPTHWTHLGFNPLHQYKWVCNDKDEIIVNYLIKLEAYNAGVEKVYEEIKKYLRNDVTIDTIKQTRKNESVNNIQLTESQKQMIFKIFKKDFEIFDYE